MANNLKTPIRIEKNNVVLTKKETFGVKNNRTTLFYGTMKGKDGKRIPCKLSKGYLKRVKAI